GRGHAQARAPALDAAPREKILGEALGGLTPRSQPHAHAVYDEQDDDREVDHEARRGLQRLEASEFRIGSISVSRRPQSLLRCPLGQRLPNPTIQRLRVGGTYPERYLVALSDTGF